MTALATAPTQIPVETSGIVIAHNPAEMKTARTKLTAWAADKEAAAQAELDDIAACLEVAERNKQRTSTLKRLRLRATRRLEYFEKIRLALDAGYVIVPDMGGDIFAIRTTAELPHGGEVTTRYGKPIVNDEREKALPTGEGDYVDAEPTQQNYTSKDTDHNGKEITVNAAYPLAWRGVELPSFAAKPVIFADLERAMQDRIFDEFAIAPSRKSSRTDPTITGRIIHPSDAGKLLWRRRAVTFLIAWWIDPTDLE
jgi:hypothetical protein